MGSALKVEVLEEEVAIEDSWGSARENIRSSIDVAVEGQALALALAMVFE